jgi:hypothetical protein
MTKLIFEFGVLVLPTVFAICYDGWGERIMLAQIIVGVTLWILPALGLNSSKRITGSSSASKANQAGSASERFKPYTVAFRALPQILTIFAILAVDFHVFPRKAAKTETFGLSIVSLKCNYGQLSNTVHNSMFIS